MKRFFSVTFVLGLCLALLVACGGNSGGSAQTSNSSDSSGGSNESDFPNKPITVIVSFAAGGITDTGARILMPYVEEQLGVDINIVNKPGGGGWVGWTELANAEPDGYTIGYINTPNFFTGYLNPNINRQHDLSSFKPIANHVTDPGAIMIRPDDKRFSNLKELVEYAKTHELTATSTGVGSDDHIAMLKMNKTLGTKFKAVHTAGNAKSSVAVMGGHVDVFFGNVGGATSLHKNGKLKAVAVMNDERAPTLPDVPTLKEAGYGEIYSWSARGIAAPAGIDPKKYEILRTAIEKAIKNKEQQSMMADLGLTVDYQGGEDYLKMLKEDEKAVKDVIDLIEWKSGAHISGYMEKQFATKM